MSELLSFSERNLHEVANYIVEIPEVGMQPLGHSAGRTSTALAHLCALCVCFTPPPQKKKRKKERKNKNDRKETETRITTSVLEQDQDCLCAVFVA